MPPTLTKSINRCKIKNIKKKIKIKKIKIEIKEIRIML